MATGISNNSLLVGNPLASVSEIESRLSHLSQTDFEQPHRLDYLPKSKYECITSGSLAPHALEEAQSVLAKYLLALRPGGKLKITQILMSEFAFAQQVQTMASLAPHRTMRTLSSDLIMSGFTNIQTVESMPLSRDILSACIPHWDLIPEKEKELTELMLSHGTLVTVEASKPEFEVGSAAKLSFGKKKTTPVEAPST